MKVIDARSGGEFEVPGFTPTVFPAGQEPRFTYGGGEQVVVHAVEPGALVARAHLTVTYVDPSSGRMVTSTAWTPLRVRWAHPSYLGRHVAFIPS